MSVLACFCVSFWLVRLAVALERVGITPAYFIHPPKFLTLMNIRYMYDLLSFIVNFLYFLCLLALVLVCMLRF